MIGYHFIPLLYIHIKEKDKEGCFYYKNVKCMFGDKKEHLMVIKGKMSLEVYNTKTISKIIVNHKLIYSRD